MWNLRGSWAGDRVLGKEEREGGVLLRLTGNELKRGGGFVEGRDE